jgi:type I restriction enzyme S subunit
MRPRVSWNEVSIKDVCESIIDCVNKTAPTVEYETPFKMIRTSNVRDGWISLDEVRYVTAEVFAKWNRRATPRKGDVILTREAPLGEVGILRGSDQVFLGQRLVLYRTDPDKLDNRFLLYALRTNFLRGQIMSYGSGATVEHMRVPDCEKLVLRLPPPAYQRRVGEILFAYDDLIENNTRRITILEETAQMIYRDWFVNFHFPGHEKVKMVESELGPIPEGWEVRSLRDVTSYISRGISPIYDESTAGWVINQKCIRDRRLNLGPARRQSKPVPPVKAVRKGDILINSTGVGTLGRVAQVHQELVNFTVDSHVSIVRPTRNADYLGEVALQLESRFEAMGVGSTGQTELGRERIAGTLFVCPPDSLQTRYADYANSIHQLSLCLSQKNDNLRTTRDFLLPKLISGEIPVEAAAELVEETA